MTTTAKTASAALAQNCEIEAVFHVRDRRKRLGKRGRHTERWTVGPDKAAAERMMRARFEHDPSLVAFTLWCGDESVAMRRR
jgi:hypothetical protein